jgi:hypothetical protein
MQRIAAMTEQQTTPIRPFHGEHEIPLSKSGDQYQCPSCGWHGDMVLILMQTKGMGRAEPSQEQSEMACDPN